MMVSNDTLKIPNFDKKLQSLTKTFSDKDQRRILQARHRQKWFYHKRLTGFTNFSNFNNFVRILEEMLTVISSEFQGDKMAEAQAAIDKLDVDKDGKVSYPEFILVMKYKK